MKKCFSLILNDLLAKKNLSMVAFARKIGVKSQTTIKNWLTDKGSPSWDQLIIIQRELGIRDIRELFGVDTSNSVTISTDEYEKALINARLDEARLIAMGKSSVLNNSAGMQNNKDSSGAGGRDGGKEVKPSATAPPE